MTEVTRIADLERLMRTYALPEQPGDRAAWQALLAKATDLDSPITVIEIASVPDEALQRFEHYLAATSTASSEAGGTLFATCDIVEPGVGDLQAYAGFAGGVVTIRYFPSRAAFIAALSSDFWQSAIADRVASVRDAFVMVTGGNTIPAALQARLGAPPHASTIPTPRVDGKSPSQIVDELLTIYPDGGADPNRAQLGVMMNFPGFRSEPVHYVNLYAFGGGSDPNAKGAAEHDAYNAAAITTALGHGGMPLMRLDVEHLLVSAIPWSRVMFVRWPSLAVFTDMRLDPTYVEAQKHRVDSSEVYGNFITLRR